MTSPPLQPAGFIILPEHLGKGTFDHAAVHAASGHVYVAHTANDAVDVFDPAAKKFLFSVPQLPGPAGVLILKLVSSPFARHSSGMRSSSTMTEAKPIMQWLTALPYPWCSNIQARERIPDIDALRPIARFLGGRT